MKLVAVFLVGITGTAAVRMFSHRFINRQSMPAASSPSMGSSAGRRGANGYYDSNTQSSQMTSASTQTSISITAMQSSTDYASSTSSMPHTDGYSATSSSSMSTRGASSSSTPMQSTNGYGYGSDTNGNSGNGNIGNGGGNGNGIGGSGQAQPPNFLIFVADDLGRTDVSYTEGNIWTPTPNIDKLAWDGIILNHHYSQPLCTPSRASLITGKYVFNIGMQTAAIAQGEPWGVPLEFKFFPAYMKDLGYQTYHLGKWHLGEFSRQYYPVARGFDYSYGFTGGATNWWNYTEGWITPVPLSGREVRENGLRILANDTNNAYYPELINIKAEQIIRNQDPSKPFFMYFATPVVHTASNGYGDALDTVPQFTLRPPVFQFSDQFPERKRMLALSQLLDESFKRITDAVVNKGIANNTIIVFYTDNGAPLPPNSAFVRGSNHGVNWPLRLGKGSLFEGGIRTNAFIWSPLLKKRGRVTNQLWHSSDWLPTLYEAAGGDLNDLTPHKLDGMSQWKSIQSGLNYGPRKELPNNIDSLGHQYAMLYEDQYGGLYKVIGGNVMDNSYLGWWAPEGTNAGRNDEVPDWKTWTPVAVNCNFPEGIEVNPCRPNVSDCLFDLTNDPCELNNIAESYPAMLKLIQGKIQGYNASSYPAAIKGYDPASNPDNWEGWWVPWKDPQPWDEGVVTNPLIPAESF
ncbi:hypothetical protein RvY_04524 [Ramazzottius varieornatus]|uniref:Sulfatase N-terminal domain-containing protein n=1 Tax=Ramazzottius varieornatus TaxID=947166 RepID=A0A1D1URW2_RAMVA|nr:hypothetical protein RvY_04524 [Ramazzottius varieornatus]